MSTNQFLRKASLLVLRDDQALNLSDMQFTFHTVQQDVESPNNCSIRVFNLSKPTTRLIQAEFDKVVINAGYSGQYGEIFQGDIKQFRMGRLNATDTYLDILAADGDFAYNNARVEQTLSAAQNTPAGRLDMVMKALGPYGVTQGHTPPFFGGVLPNPRGKVAFGMARRELRGLAASNLATWSIDNGKVNIIPMSGYLPGAAVVLTALTGLIGLPEQTNEGIKAKCLLNPLITVGGLVQIDNDSINQLVKQNPNAAPVAYNQYTGIQYLASTASDGLYRVYVAEHSGDTRGQDWYTELTCLAVNPQSNQTVDYG